MNIKDIYDTIRVGNPVRRESWPEGITIKVRESTGLFDLRYNDNAVLNKDHKINALDFLADDWEVVQ